MTILDAVYSALRSLVANKMRTSLTLLGMVIGVGAVVTLMSIGAGVQTSIEEQIRTFGTNQLFVTPGGGRDDPFGGFLSRRQWASTLTLDDANAIRAANIEGIARLDPTRSSGGSLVSSDAAVTTSLEGVTEEYVVVHNAPIAEGAFFSATDLADGTRVLVLGATLAEDLFPNGGAVGSTVRLNSQLFTVVGVLTPQGGNAFSGRDGSGFIPFSTLALRMEPSRTTRGEDLVDRIVVQLTDESNATVTRVTQEIETLLLQRHASEEQDFSVTSQAQAIQAVAQITGIMSLFLGAVAGISLLVGGIGIMNIMLVSVTERTREIGIRKAIGAKRRDIMTQFMIEAMAVSLGGGLAGAAFGIAMSLGLNGLTFGQGGGDTGGDTGGGPDGNPFADGLTTTITTQPILLALGVSIAIGLVFGVYPAARAARLSPIEALRYE